MANGSFILRCARVYPEVSIGRQPMVRERMRNLVRHQTDDLTMVLVKRWKNLGNGRSIFRSKYDIGMLSMEGDRARKPLLQHEKYSEAEPQISPDGRWMAYRSNESGKYEVYVRPFPEVNKGRWQVSLAVDRARLMVAGWPGAVLP